MTDDLFSRLYRAIKRMGSTVWIIVIPGRQSRENDEQPAAGVRDRTFPQKLQLHAPEQVYSVADEEPPHDGAANGDVWSARDVLIGSLRSREQLSACLRDDFYYIPAERVPEERLPIRYVALYQTPNVFFDDAGVRWYGEVVQTELVRRKKIKEVPLRRTADGERLYYRFTVDRWLSLDKPVRPQEFSFVNEFTNLFLLNNASYVPELLLRSAEEYRFYSALKRLIKRSAENSDDRGFAVGDTAVVLRDGRIKVFCSNALRAEYPAAEYAHAVYSLFRKIQAALSDR